MLENKVYEVEVLRVEHPENKNMRTLVLAVPKEKVVYRGVSFFLDNKKNAQQSMSIWLRNIYRQTDSNETVKDAQHIEYLQEVEGKFTDRDRNEVAVEQMLEQLENLEKGTKFNCTFISTVSNGTRYYNLVPYEVNDQQTTDTEEAGIETL